MLNLLCWGLFPEPACIMPYCTWDVLRRGGWFSCHWGNWGHAGGVKASGSRTGMACPVFSALEKQRTVLPPWGRSVASLHGANKCPVVCVTAAGLKGKKQSKPTLYVEGRPKGSLNPLRKGHSSAERLECISWGSPRAPTSPFCCWPGHQHGGEPRAGAL